MKNILLYIVLNGENFYFKNCYTSLSEQEYIKLLSEVNSVNEHYRTLLRGEADHTLYDDAKDKLYLSLLYKKRKEERSSSDPHRGSLTVENIRMLQSMSVEPGQYPDEDPDTYDFLRIKERIVSVESSTETTSEVDEVDSDGRAISEEETSGGGACENTVHDEVEEAEEEDDDVLYPDLIQEIFSSNFMSKDECAYMPGTAWTKKYGEIPVTLKKCVF